LIRTDPMPTPEELADYYASAYRADYQLAFAGGPPRNHLNRSAREATFRANLLAPKLKAGARVLDFGSGSGEFLAAVRAKAPEAGGEVPAAALTAYSRPEDRAASMLAGYDAHLSKPVDLHELIATVVRLRARRRT
jgi:CheY-like chemotaxis protein